MDRDYWFLDPTLYGSALQRFDIAEPEYLSALQQVENLFPRESSRQYYRDTMMRLGGLGHFDLLPYPNQQQASYNPVPILLSIAGGALPQLLYLGLALRDFRRVFGQTNAIRDITSNSEKNYRGALFEIEVGAELARSGLKPTYRTTSPDFILTELPLGVEATIREVPLHRAVAERLIWSLSKFEFKHLFVELTIKDEHDIDELMNEIADDTQRLLSTCRPELIQSRYRLGHDLAAQLELKTLEISLGNYRYAETLPYLITNCLVEKQKQIRKGLSGKAAMTCVVALDTRSLLEAPFEARSEYERQWAEHNQPHFDRQLVLRQQVVKACQAFVADSNLIKGVLLWGRNRPKCPAEEVHRRYSVTLVTSKENIEVDKNNLAGEFGKIAQGQMN